MLYDAAQLRCVMCAVSNPIVGGSGHAVTDFHRPSPFVVVTPASIQILVAPTPASRALADRRHRLLTSVSGWCQYGRGPFVVEVRAGPARATRRRIPHGALHVLRP